MSDLISRSKAKEELLSWAVVINKPDLLSREDALTVLGMIPTVDAVPVVHGRWQVSEEYNTIFKMNVVAYTCSACGETRLSATSLSQATKYCPNC